MSFKKFSIVFVFLTLLNTQKCDKPADKTSNTSNKTDCTVPASFVPISSFPLRAKYRREDDLGNGNFAWVVTLQSTDSGVLRFDYEIRIRNGDGTIESLEKSASLAPGATGDIRIKAACILSVKGTHVERV